MEGKQGSRNGNTLLDKVLHYLRNSISSISTVYQMERVKKSYIVLCYFEKIFHIP